VASNGRNLTGSEEKKEEKKPKGLFLSKIEMQGKRTTEKKWSGR